MEKLTKEQYKLVLEETSYVSRVAKAMSNEMNLPENLKDEVVSDAYYALCKMTKTYDGQVPFHYYVMSTIRYRIVDEIRIRLGRLDARNTRNIKWHTTHPIYLSLVKETENDGEIAYLDSLLGGEIDFNYLMLECVDEVNEILESGFFDRRIREIIFRRMNGESMIFIGKSMGISESRISQILKPFKNALKSRWLYAPEEEAS